MACAPCGVFRVACFASPWLVNAKSAEINLFGRGQPPLAIKLTFLDRIDTETYAKPLRMTFTVNLRSLRIDLPAQPAALARLTALLQQEHGDLGKMAGLIESDMALASAVLNVVNSALYGLTGHVQSVQQAIASLGTREVASLALQMGLRAVFPPAEALEQLWRRAASRAVLMGMLGQELHLDTWAAHSAGLFEECGKALLFRHSALQYGPLLTQAANDPELLLLEQQAFGIGHDRLGAALCETWGLSAAVTASVRHHVEFQVSLDLPAGVQQPWICALSALAHVASRSPEAIAAGTAAVADQMNWTHETVANAMSRAQARMAARQTGS